MNRLLVFLSLTFTIASASAQTPQVDASKETAQLALLEKAYFNTKAAFEKKPSDKSKSAFVVSTVKFGTASMTATSLSPKVKYRRALRLYREALKHDPKNAEALNNKAMIEGIYKSMGRPIPT